MVKKRKNKKKKNRPNQFSAGTPKVPKSDCSEEMELPDSIDEEIIKAMSEMQEENPQLVENIFSELNNWREEFFNEHGREPEEEDLMALFDDNDDWSDIGELDSELESEGEFDICNICAWCRNGIKSDEERFTFGVKTKIDVTPFDDPTQPLIMTLSDGRQIEAIITTLDSPARREGYQLLIVCCSDACIESAQQALQEAIDIDTTGMLN